MNHCRVLLVQQEDHRFRNINALGKVPLRRRATSMTASVLRRNGWYPRQSSRGAALLALEHETLKVMNASGENCRRTSGIRESMGPARSGCASGSQCAFPIGVITTVGCTEFTRIPCGPSSSAIVLVSMSSAPLAEEYRV